MHRGLIISKRYFFSK